MKSPGPASTTDPPPGPNSSRIAPLTTYRLVSWSPWWCQPDVAPGSVCTSPAHSPGTPIACCRCIPGVGSASVSRSGPITSTGAPPRGASSAKTVSCSPAGPESRLLSESHGVPVGGAMTSAPAAARRSVTARQSSTSNATRTGPATRLPTSTSSMYAA